MSNTNIKMILHINTLHIAFSAVPLIKKNLMTILDSIKKQ